MIVHQYNILYKESVTVKEQLQTSLAEHKRDVFESKLVDVSYSFLSSKLEVKPYWSCFGS